MQVKTSIEHLFRREYGKIVSALTKKYTSKNIDLIEDAIQEALYKAMNMWSFKPMPENPSGWLYKVANNYIIDVLRRNSKLVEHEPAEEVSPEIDEQYLTSGIADDQLKMIFACCHSSLTETEQIMLSLKLLCGFSNLEIGSALMKSEEAVKRAITRAKDKFKTEIGNLEIPNERELPNRFDNVINVLYLLFNEGYKATDGENLIKSDVCAEAIRLALLLQQIKNIDEGKLNALLALMYFNFARFDARTDAEGNLVTLENQERSLWNRDAINLGYYYLYKSSKSKEISNLQLEAAIAGLYVSAASFNETDWQSILNLYDTLIQRNPSPVIKLNRLVVLEKISGTEIALNELMDLANVKSLQNHYLFYSIKASFEKSLGNIDTAKHDYQKAIDLTNNEIEKRFLNSELDKLR